MTTNRSIRILVAAVAIAAAISAFKWYGYRAAAAPGRLSYRCFDTGSGWGYDILVGDKIVIHQSIDPQLTGRKGFASRSAAAADARNVIDKIKLGETPVFSVPGRQRSGSLPAH